ncbi:MAG TPA: hypothetical protein ENI41_05905 [Deltaproteobacteria bacterium]|nr:hypothetical protein [Deltaproteobacteria bacterium]
MNKEFLEFWGNLLVDVARKQKRAAEIGQWISSGFKGFEDLTEQFKKFYGLDKLSENDPQYASLWEKSVSDFRSAFKEYLELFDVVSREKYEEVARECKELKDKVKRLEERIKQLEALLGAKGFEYASVATEFQKLVEKQTREFQKMMEGFTAPFEKTDSKKSNT